MGQKVHPGGFRVGVIHDWKSHWYTEKEFSKFLLEDERVRAHIMRKLAHAGLSRIIIRKDQNNVTIDIHTARPGIVIGKSGSEVDALRKEIHALTSKNVQVNIVEVKRPELDAVLVAQSIAEQLENRVSFRRAMKRALTSAMRSGAAGMRVRCGGRLGGAEMARNEHYSEGRVPLHTLRADIDYGFREARTTFGRIGVKVWINKGEILPEGYPMDEAKARQERDEQRRDDRGRGPRRDGGGRPGGPGGPGGRSGGPGGPGGRSGGPGGPGGRSGGPGGRAGGPGGRSGGPGGRAGGPGGPGGRQQGRPAPSGPSVPMGRKAPDRKAPPAPADKAKAPAEPKPAAPTTEQSS
ncbi:MAG: 30S ribosomal protein S3 [Actinomycetes bacterium]